MLKTNYILNLNSFRRCLLNSEEYYYDYNKNELKISEIGGYAHAHLMRNLKELMMKRVYYRK